jgi:hypothetical protein
LIAYISLGIGTIAAIFFIKIINEPELVKVCHEKQENLKALVAEQKAFDKKIVKNVSDISLGSDDEG